MTRVIRVKLFLCKERFFVLHDLRLLRAICILQTVSALKRGLDFCQAFLVRRKIFVLHDLRPLKLIYVLQTMSTLK